MALTQKGDNINWSLIFERPKTVEEKGGGKERRRGRGREEEERKIKGMDSMILVWNCMDHLDFLYRYMFVGCRKPNRRMNSCMEIITNLFVFLGFCYERT